MMKRTIAILLCLSVVFAAGAAAASAVSEDEMRNILNEMEIMTYNGDGDFEAGYSLTRAQLAKILVTLSENKGLASESSKTSPFFDVPYKHWGASYISLAASEGIMYGYTDGSFRPEQTVLFEEAVTAVLRRLGYADSDITGSYPTGQLNVARNIGLLDDISLEQGEGIRRSDMAVLLYNALNCDVKSGQNYASTLGYTISGSDLRLSDVVSKNTKGPYTATGSGYISSLGLSSPTVYLNGKSASASDIQNYDIVYYSAKSNTVWAYRDRATGVLQAISPNKETPTSITVSGATYALTGEAAKEAVGLDGLEIGDNVTLLLDRTGQCADVVLTEEMYTTRVGVALSYGNNAQKSDYLAAGYYATVLLTDGSTFDISTSSDAKYLVGEAVLVNFASGAVTKTSSSYSVVGTVDASAKTIGTALLSDDCSIIEIDGLGSYGRVLLSRIDGVTLKSDDVKLVSFDASGKVDGIILENVTGDLNDYGYVTSVNESSGVNGTPSGSYTVYFSATASHISLSGRTLGISRGPNYFSGEGDDMTADSLLEADGAVAAVNPLYVTFDDGSTFKVADDLLVFDVTSSGSPVLSDVETLNESNASVIDVYYDDTEAKGGRVRVICYK